MMLPMTSARSPLRLQRGGVAASVATAVALGGHLVAGAEMPSWLGVALPWWLAVAVCTVLAGTRFSLLRMGVAVLSSQALFHGLFTAGTPGDPALRMVDPPGSESVSEAGQVFVSFQADLNGQFLPIQRRLDALDLLNQWTTPIGSAVFAIPPGCAEGDYVGRSVLE